MKIGRTCQVDRAFDASLHFGFDGKKSIGAINPQ